MGTITNRLEALRQPVVVLAASIAVLGAGTAIALRRGDDPAPRAAIVPTPAPTPSPAPSPVPTLAPTPSPTAAPAVTAGPPRTARPKASPRPVTPKPPPPPPRSSITAAFYYGWYPGVWEAGGTRWNPSAGRYSSHDPATVQRHVAIMRHMGMQAGIFSWLGADTNTDPALSVALRAADGTPFKWSIYYEPEGPNYPNLAPDQLRASLQYLRDKFMNDANYLKIDGRPVLFVWPDPNDDCAMIRRWKEANTLGIYVVHKVFPPRSTACEKETDSWHQYAPAHATIEGKPGWSYSVSPGFWHYAQEQRLARDPARFEAGVKAMAAANVQWKLVTTFNEWAEGTAVESAQEWASPSGYGVYVDILNRILGAR